MPLVGWLSPAIGVEGCWGLRHTHATLARHTPARRSRQISLTLTILATGYRSRYAIRQRLVIGWSLYAIQDEGEGIGYATPLLPAAITMLRH